MPAPRRAPPPGRPSPGLLLCAAALLVGGCLDPIPAGTLTPGAGTIRGAVHRWCGSQPPLAGAAISVDGVVRAHTDESGAYRIEGVSAGRAHVMAADLPGYVHTETLVRVSPGGAQDQNFVLETPGDAATTVQLDVLFVIDDSATMAGRQAALVAAFPTMAARLESASLNLHLGIITADLGAGPRPLSQCMPGGDGGLLQLQPRGATCDHAAVLPGYGTRYLWMAREAGGPPRPNYEGGSLADAFACYAPVGTAGCGFPMPLEAMARALDPLLTDNGDFVQPGGTLLVVVVTDGDDCSAPDATDLFDPFQTGLASPLGPLTPYRCFEFGVTCGGLPPGRTPGQRSDCHAGTPDPDHALEPLSRYVDVLASTYGGRVVLGVVAGAPADAVEVIADADGFPRLVPSCQVAGDSAAPAVRLADLTTSLAGTTNFQSICQPDRLGDALDKWAEQALSLAVAARSCAE